jgi:hypothetical protein
VVEVQEHVDPARERHRALVRAQALASEMNGDEGGRAQRVDADARTLEPERVREAPRDHGRELAGGRVRVDAIDVPALRAELGVAGVERPNEDAGRAPRERVGRNAGMLERLPRHLEKDALLRVHALGLRRRDAEQGCVEGLDRVEETELRQVVLSGRVGIGVEVRSIPARARIADDGVAPLGEHLPEARRPVGAGKATAEADDRHRLARTAPRLRLLEPTLVESTLRRAETKESFVQFGHAVTVTLVE